MCFHPACEFIFCNFAKGKGEDVKFQTALAPNIDILDGEKTDCKRFVARCKMKVYKYISF
jgi:uncharacterized protein YuzB (UPF0349 family)